MIKIIKPGYLTTIQDNGRSGYRHLGISSAGALDKNALFYANALLDNEESAASIEFLRGTLEIEFLTDADFCFIGHQFSSALTTQLCTVNNENISHVDNVSAEMVHSGWVYSAKKNQRLILQTTAESGTAYLSFKGGLDVPLIFGSRSTDLNNGFGGLNGRALQAGDIIKVQSNESDNVIKNKGIRLDNPPNSIRVIPGIDFSIFDEHAKKKFWECDWNISSDSNRMGLRLMGEIIEPLSLRAAGQMHSHAVIPGTIQIPPSGEPIILNSDAQTTGGYPRIGQVIAADLPYLAQIPINSSFQFTPCSLETALQALKKQESSKQRLLLNLHPS